MLSQVQGCKFELCARHRYKGSGVQVRRYDRLHHNHAGVVSVSEDGSEVGFSFNKAISLDKDHQVRTGGAHFHRSCIPLTKNQG